MRKLGKFLHALLVALFWDTFLFFLIWLGVTFVFDHFTIDFIDFYTTIIIVFVLVLLYTVYSFAANDADEMLDLRKELNAAREKEFQIAEKEVSLNNRQRELDSRVRQLQAQYEILKNKERTLDERAANISREIDAAASSRLHSMLNSAINRGYFSGTAVFDEIQRISPIEMNRRLMSAKAENALIRSPMMVSADIRGREDNIYHTTLNSCTCPDYLHRKAPCKHMYRLAIEVGLMLSVPHADIDAALSRLSQKSLELRDYKRKKEQAEKTLLEKKQEITDREKQYQKLIAEKEQTYPWLAKMIADYLYAIDLGKSYYRKYEADPRIHYSEQIKPLAAEKRSLQYQCKLYEYQLNYYESLFPWLEDLKLVSPKEGAQYAPDLNADSDYDRVHDWVSKNDYEKLSTTEKNQLALDSYMKRKRTNWDAGIEYERYVGYKYEQKGYRVQYTGATLGLEDMGRDLVVENDEKILVIQCKRWIDERIVHEKHVFQLYGSAVLFAVDRKKPVECLIVTTTTLSDTARECAGYLKVACREKYPLEPHPMIKCNVSKDGQKIYHLPFDQQYDRVVIKPELGEFYAWTVQEAEDAGFRRAYRWRGQ